MTINTISGFSQTAQSCPNPVLSAKTGPAESEISGRGEDLFTKTDSNAQAAATDNKACTGTEAEICGKQADNDEKHGFESLVTPENIRNLMDRYLEHLKSEDSHTSSSVENVSNPRIMALFPDECVPFAEQPAEPHSDRSAAVNASAGKEKQVTIKDLFDSISGDNVKVFRWAKSGAGDKKTVSLDPSEIMDGFLSGGKGLMKAKQGFLKADIQFIEVQTPEIIKEIITTMRGVANLSYNEMSSNPEFAMLIYADEDMKVRTMVEKGKNGFFQASVAPEPFIEDPGGKRIILLGALAHTHPDGAPIPSEGDYYAASFYRKYGQVESILVVPGSGGSTNPAFWVMFDDDSIIKPTKLSEESYNKFLMMPVNEMVNPRENFALKAFLKDAA